MLRRFELRDGTGGAGRNRGGDGVTREIEFSLQYSALFFQSGACTVHTARKEASLEQQG